MSATTESQKSTTRLAILEAAIQVFARLGYSGTNFREITALCGAQRSLILYHFQNKATLWQAAAEEIERRFNGAFDSVYTEQKYTSDRETARYALACFLDALCEVPEYGQIYLREGATDGPRMEWLSRHFAPRQALKVHYRDAEIQQRVHTSILRDILASTLVAFVTLGPLLERSRSVATGKSAGVYPLTPAKREELVEYLLKLIF